MGVTREDKAQDAQAEATPKAQRRRRASTGGLRQKLDAPQRPGYVRRFVDASPARIQAMHQLGYELVADEAAEGAARTDGMGTRIQRLAGKRDNGEPQHLVLMETPAEEYQIGVKEKEQALAPFEEAIRAGADTTGRLTDQYEPRDRSSINHSA